MFHRHAIAALDTWRSKARRKPLVLRGARQVGKSTLVREFARKKGLQLVEVNLERHPRLSAAFATMNPEIIVRDIRLAVGAGPLGSESLLFLDEIQAIPAAIQSLRYFYEEKPKQAVIAAGSLLEFVLADHGFSMPVGRIEYLHLGPMTFSEYLLAVGDKVLCDYMQECALSAPWQGDQQTSDVGHQGLVQRFREFLFVGGMPEAVLEFTESALPERVSDVHRSIVATYRDDFNKYIPSRSRLPSLERTFAAIPAGVGRKVKFSDISRDDRAAVVRDAIDLLSLARVIHKVHHSDCSGLPLGASADAKTFKPLFVDVGLMNHLVGLRLGQITTMNETRLVNEGALAEQFIGQHLAYIDNGREEPRLHYWLRQARTGNAEVDYVMGYCGQIFPIEVKAGKAGTLKSLHQFVARRLRNEPQSLALRFHLGGCKMSRAEFASTSQKAADVVARFDLLSMPLYLVEHTHTVLDALRGD